jgi:hypothetical protein
VTSPFTETQHFDVTLGGAMLRRMIGRPTQSPWSDDALGERIDSTNVAQNEQALEIRRQGWLASPDAQALSDLVRGWRMTDSPTPSSDRSFLTAEDFAGL